MPDAPLFIDARAWERIERAYGALFEARDADTKTKQRLVMCALIYAKREHTYQIDAATFMLTTENWMPIEGVHEADLIQALTEQRRRFMKPLRYDARSAASFPNVLLLDTGAKPTPLSNDRSIRSMITAGDEMSRPHDGRALTAELTRSYRRGCPRVVRQLWLPLSRAIAQ